MHNAVFSIIFFCSSIGVGYACSCIPVNSAEEYCARDMIFRGKALAEYKQRDAPSDPWDTWMSDQFAHWVYTIQVDEVFWAKDGFTGMKTISVTTPVADNLCGMRFMLDVPYLFSVLYDNASTNGTFSTGLCDENVSWDYVKEADRWFISNLIPGYCSRQNTKNGTATEPLANSLQRAL